MNSIEAMLLDPHIGEVLAKAQEVVAGGRATIYYQWTCRGCGERVMCDDANSLYTSLTHLDCGYETPTIDGDLGFALLMKPG